MALPNVPYAATTNPQMVYLDQTFAAVGALGIIPCDTGGTANAIVLTPKSNTPSLLAYANYQQFSFKASAPPSGNVTVQVLGLGTVKLFRPGQPTTQATTNDYPGDALLVIAYDSALDSGLGGFALVSAVQPAIVPASAAEARAATNGSTAMTPRNMQFHPMVDGGSVTWTSGPVVAIGHNLRVLKTGLGQWSLTFTSTAPSTANFIVTTGQGESGFVRWTAQGTSGVVIVARNAADSANIDLQPISVAIKGTF
jgi:hypothetical protein